jgi:hypothetical protein
VECAPGGGVAWVFPCLSDSGGGEGLASWAVAHLAAPTNMDKQSAKMAKTSGRLYDLESIKDSS